MKNNGKIEFGGIKTFINRLVDGEWETIDLVISGVINLGRGDDSPEVIYTEIKDVETGLDIKDEITKDEEETLDSNITNMYL